MSWDKGFQLSLKGSTWDSFPKVKPFVWRFWTDVLKEKTEAQHRVLVITFSPLRVHGYYSAHLAVLSEETSLPADVLKQILASDKPSQCPLGLSHSISDRISHRAQAPLPQHLCSLTMNRLLQRIQRMVLVTSSLQLSLLLRDERLVRLSAASS